jgi:hypothetical protein
LEAVDKPSPDGRRVKTMGSSIEQMRIELANAISEIEGWTDFETAWVIHEVARCFPIAARDITIVELGCWKGRSTIALALGAKSRGGGRVYAIDPHTGSEQTIYLCGRVDTYEEFLRNIKAARLSEFVEPIRNTAHQARGRFLDSFVHLLFVDGSREYDQVVEYMNDWSTALVEGALVGFRDPWLVYPALRRRVLGWHLPFRKPTFIDDSTGPLLLFEFRKKAPWTYQDSIALLLLGMQRRVGTLIYSHFFHHMPGWARSVIEFLYDALGRAVSDGRRFPYPEAA